MVQLAVHTHSVHGARWARSVAAASPRAEDHASAALSAPTLWTTAKLAALRAAEFATVGEDAILTRFERCRLALLYRRSHEQAARRALGVTATSPRGLDCESAALFAPTLWAATKLAALRAAEFAMV
eukprot:1116454-Prymnesium_polylepis.2